jgi:hypothetical protein
MADTAVHLVEEVIAEVAVRQWVCSLPWRLRVLLGYDRRLCAEVLDAFVVELSRSLKRRAKALLGLDSVDDALTGAISFIQRGDSALRLNVDFHVLALDGVYVRRVEGGPLVSHALAAPTAEELAEVAERTALRIQKVLARHGRTLDGTGAGDAAEALGVNVHAEVAVPARDRAQLERLARYLCRPPIAQERLEETAVGKLRYTLKRPWRDGTIAIVLESMDLLARVCALIPPPRFHVVRYHGVLSSHAKVRAEVVPHAPDRAPKQLPLFESDASILPPEPRRRPWAWLLRHAFEVDVTTCPRCGRVTRWLEAATTRTPSPGCSPSTGSAPVLRRRAAPRPVSSASCSRRRSQRPPDGRLRRARTC